MSKKAMIGTIAAFLVGICVALCACFLFMKPSGNAVPSPAGSTVQQMPQKNQENKEQNPAPVAKQENAGSRMASIDLQKAKEIAFQHAGVQEGAAQILEMKPDAEDGRSVFEIKFMADGNQYKYDILQTEGSIYSYEYEHEGWIAPSISGISLEEAKAQVLQHAGLDAGAVQFSKMKTDYDDGVKLYELDFFAGKNLYEYEIASSGIIKKCKVKFCP